MFPWLIWVVIIVPGLLYFVAGCVLIVLYVLFLFMLVCLVDVCD